MLDTADNLPLTSAAGESFGFRELVRADAIGDQSDHQIKKGQRRRQVVETYWDLLKQDPEITNEQVAAKLGEAWVQIWRWLKLLKEQELGPESPVDLIERALTPGVSTGRKDKWRDLLTREDVCKKLRTLHAATLGTSSAAMQNDRRTGSVTATLKRFAIEPECPAELAPALLHGRFPKCLKKFLGKVTPETEAFIRGAKHFQLYGPSGQRDKVIGLPDGRVAKQPAGWVIELDDMSVNQPFWVEGPDGEPMLSRQGLYARCLQGGWRAVLLVSRVREAYTAADILRFIRQFCIKYGKPRKFRIEKSVWAARPIAGFKKIGEAWQEDRFDRPAMSADQRTELTQGLEAIGVEIEYCHSARGKATLEGAFDDFQKYLATFTTDLLNIGRHAGEFEKAAKQLRRVRAGSHHPRDLGFPHQSELLQRILQTFDFINALPRDKAATYDQRWAEDTQRVPLSPLQPRDFAAFLPLMRERQILGGAVYPEVDGRQFCFRALEFAELGDGFKVFVRFDPDEPSLGAAIYNREGDNLANHESYRVGQLICLADFDVPAPTTYADSVPAGLETYDPQEYYGGVSDGGRLLRQQQKRVRRFVRDAFGAVLPGQPATKITTQRDGTGNLRRVEQGPASADPLPPAPKPVAKLPRRSGYASQEDFASQRNRVNKQAELAKRLREQQEAEI